MVCLRNDLEAHSKDQILAFSAMKQTAVEEINTLQAELERMKTKIRQSSKKHSTVSVELTLEQLKHVQGLGSADCDLVSTYIFKRA